MGVFDHVAGSTSACKTSLADSFHAQSTTLVTQLLQHFSSTFQHSFTLQVYRLALLPFEMLPLPKTRATITERKHKLNPVC
jgi:hypothetical protein